MSMRHVMGTGCVVTLLAGALVWSVSSAAADDVGATARAAAIADPSGPGKIVFTSGPAVSSDIYAMNPDGTGLTRLTTSSSRNIQPVLSPDGSRIAFASDRDGDFEPD